MFLEEGPRGLGESGQSQQFKTASDQQEKLNEDPGPWVGPISGFIEFYRYNSNKRAMYQDGTRYVSSPLSNYKHGLCAFSLLFSFPFSLMLYRK